VFFALSKTVGLLALPSNLLVVLAVVGLLLWPTRFAAWGRKLTLVAVVLIAIAGLSPLGNLLMAPLEQRFPPWDASRGPPDGIVVLGGSIDPDLSLEHRSPALNESAERLTVVATLARDFPKARILFSGGNGDLIKSDTAEADVVTGLFVSFGIARDRIMLERQSRNTLENAIFSKALVRPQQGERWLLVTSAFHMPRSVAAFRAAGFAVEPYPVDWRVDAIHQILPFTAVSAGLARTDVAVREWAGLLAYRLSGKSPVLFPAP
jgi:uncharacterized SAM-binding protein YcdF (DUF218 family)